MRHLCVLRVSFGCLELCVFLFERLLYAPWARLRRGAQRPHYYHRYHLWPVKRQQREKATDDQQRTTAFCAHKPVFPFERSRRRRNSASNITELVQWGKARETGTGRLTISAVAGPDEDDPTLSVGQPVPASKLIHKHQSGAA